MTDAIARPLDSLPLFALLAATLLLFFGFYETGFRLGRLRGPGESVATTQVGAIMAGVLGLLALMLAFSFGMAGARFDARKQAVLDEANAIGTTWLRSRMLPPPHPREIGALLERYVEVRLEAVGASPATLRKTIAESEALHDRLWNHAVVLGRQQPRSVPIGLFIQSLNDMIDIHEERVSFSLRYRLATGVWLTLYFIACTSLIVVGIHAGLTGTRYVPVTVLLVLTLSVTMMLVIDLDRPLQTLFSVSQNALVDLKQELERASDARGPGG